MECPETASRGSGSRSGSAKARISFPSGPIFIISRDTGIDRVSSRAE